MTDISLAHIGRTRTTVGAILCAAHRSRDGRLHGHTWRVWVTFPCLGGPLDATTLKATLERFLSDMGDHGVLPDRLAWGEAIAEDVGRGLVADYVRVERPDEMIVAEWFA